MIEQRSGERTGVVADTTILVGQHVVEGFADGEHVIMAGFAVIHDSRMIKGCR